MISNYLFEYLLLILVVRMYCPFPKVQKVVVSLDVGMLYLVVAESAHWL